MGGKVLEYEAKANREEGIEKGIEKGEKRFAKLIQALLQEKKFDVIALAAKDSDKRRELYKTYGI